MTDPREAVNDRGSAKTVGDPQPASQTSESRTDFARVRGLVETIGRDGFAIANDVLEPEQLNQLREAAIRLMGPRGRNPFEGYATQRVYGVMARTAAHDPLAEHPLVLDVVDRFLESSYLLSQLVAINIEPGEAAQALHHDDILYPIPRPRPAVSIATMRALDDFTEANGATRVIGGSHSWGNRSPDAAEVLARSLP